MLFLPSESLFAQLVQDFPAIWQEANRHRVWIAYPTTLMAVLTTLRGVVRGMSLQQKTADMRSEIGEMLKDVDRLVRGTEKYSSNAQNIVDVTKKIFGQLKCGRGKFNDGN
jgi:DNA recombination protein RmuC